jgi:hypothetical protein
LLDIGVLGALLIVGSLATRLCCDKQKQTEEKNLNKKVDQCEEKHIVIPLH